MQLTDETKDLMASIELHNVTLCIYAAVAASGTTLSSADIDSSEMLLWIGTLLLIATDGTYFARAQLPICE